MSLEKDSYKKIMESLMKRADELLYKSKAAGRNYLTSG
jgi:PleD family two-component response regulator